MNAKQKESLAALKAECKRVIEVAEKATAGPWEACEMGDYNDFEGRSRVICSKGKDPQRIGPIHSNGGDETESNAELIASSRTLTPMLAKMVLVALGTIEGYSVWNGEQPYTSAASDLLEILDLWEARNK